MDSLPKEGEEPALILISIVAILFFSLSDGGRPYKEEVRPSEKVEEDDKDGREEQEDCLNLRMN